MAAAVAGGRAPGRPPAGGQRRPQQRAGHGGGSSRARNLPHPRLAPKARACGSTAAAHRLQMPWYEPRPTLTTLRPHVPPTGAALTGGRPPPHQRDPHAGWGLDTWGGSGGGSAVPCGGAILLISIRTRSSRWPPAPPARRHAAGVGAGGAGVGVPQSGRPSPQLSAPVWVPVGGVEKLPLVWGGGEGARPTPPSGRAYEGNPHHTTDRRGGEMGGAGGRRPRTVDSRLDGPPGVATWPAAWHAASLSGARP